MTFARPMLRTVSRSSEALTAVTMALSATSSWLRRSISTASSAGGRVKSPRRHEAQVASAISLLSPRTKGSRLRQCQMRIAAPPVCAS